MKVALLAPIDNSLYARLVAHLVLEEPGLELTGVVVRTPWSLSRIRSEWRRDGNRLLEKVVSKLILAEKQPGFLTPLESFARDTNLDQHSLSQICIEQKIPYVIVKDLNDTKAQTRLAKNIPDIIAFTGGGLIRKDLLQLPKLGILNCHSGILPYYRGMDVVEWPILEQRFDRIGLTLHYMEPGVDTGPILLQKRVTQQKGESIAQLRLRMEPLMVQLMLEGLRQLRDGKMKTVTQDPQNGKQYFVMHPRLKTIAHKMFRELQP